MIVASTILASALAADCHTVAEGLADLGSGALETHAIGSRIQERHSALQACYQQELQREPALAIEVTATLVVDAAGGVACADLEGDSPPEFRLCALEVLGELDFDPPGGLLQIHYPLVFRPRLAGEFQIDGHTYRPFGHSDALFVRRDHQLLTLERFAVLAGDPARVAPLATELRRRRIRTRSALAGGLVAIAIGIPLQVAASAPQGRGDVISCDPLGTCIYEQDDGFPGPEAGKAGLYWTGLGLWAGGAVTVGITGSMSDRLHRRRRNLAEVYTVSEVEGVLREAAR